jgi:hypothetical protein
MINPQSTKTRPTLILYDDEIFNSRIGHNVMALLGSPDTTGILKAAHLLFPLN